MNMILTNISSNISPNRKGYFNKSQTIFTVFLAASTLLFCIINNDE